MREKVEELIRKLAAEYLSRESNRTSLVTVTRAEVASTQRTASVYITVLPDSEEERALAFCRRKENDFWLYMKKHSKLKVLPTIRFVLDKGEKNREKLARLTEESEKKAT